MDSNKADSSQFAPSQTFTRHDPNRTIRAPRGGQLSCKSWLTEAPFRMIQNNLDPEVAEHPSDLVVYGGIGRAARSWESFDTILETLKELEDDETLLIQSGKPVGVFRTHSDAPRVLIANSNLVPHWATWEHFSELDQKGLIMYGQMTAGSWIYIGSQGIVQGTYETFFAIAKRHFQGIAQGRWILTAGLGGMGGAQPLAATMAGFSMIAVECDETRIDFRLKSRYLDKRATNLDEALLILEEAKSAGKAVSIGLLGNAVDIYQEILARGIKPDGLEVLRPLLLNHPKWGFGQPALATWEHFSELDQKGLIMYGQMTAGSWIYIGSQGIVQGTYETFFAIAKRHFQGIAQGRWILTAGLGGMGGAQPLAATMANDPELTRSVITWISGER